MIVMYQMRMVVNTAQIAKQAMLTLLSQVLFLLLFLLCNSLIAISIKNILVFLCAFIEYVRCYYLYGTFIISYGHSSNVFHDFHLDFVYETIVILDLPNADGDLSLSSTEYTRIINVRMERIS